VIDLAQGLARSSWYSGGDIADFKVRDPIIAAAVMTADGLL